MYFHFILFFVELTVLTLQKKNDIAGPLTEVNLPIDSFTKKLKGFAFITYMIPEHAVKAFSELDGKIFQV